MIILPEDNKQFFTKKELFAYIRACGFKIDDSLLEEFQKQGLMLPPQRRGKGRAKGVPGVWTRQQRDLLRTLCMMRERHNIRHVAERCNLLVWVWLYWGDEYAVTRDQVKQVMKTWAKHYQHPSQKQSRQTATQLVNDVANVKEGRKQLAVREITEMLYTGNFTAEEFNDSLSHVFDPTKRANGPDDIPVEPENMSEYIELWAEAVKALANGRVIPDMQWEWARCFHLTHFSQYAKVQQRYARETAGSPVEHTFSVETIETLYSSACSDLAAVLGLGLRYPATPGMPETLRLDVWKSRVKSTTVTSEQIISPLILPDGSRSQYLKINVAVTLFNQEKILRTQELFENRYFTDNSGDSLISL